MIVIISSLIGIVCLGIGGGLPLFGAHLEDVAVS